MHQLFNFPAEELEKKDTIYISIALELHAISLTDDKDRIQFENLMNQAEKELEKLDLEDHDLLLKQLNEVRIHKNSLANQTGGLALYITTANIYYYDLAVPVEENVTIGESPYILPLIENFQYEQDYHLLLITRDRARLFEGHGPNLSELDMTEENEDAPVDLETALGTEREGGELNFGTYSSTTGGDGSSQFFHGHNETSQEKDIDREHYFRIVDRFVYDHYSVDQKWPLIVYTTEENQSVFHSLSKNEHLSDFKIIGSTANMKDNEIKEKVTNEIMDLIGQEKKQALMELEEVSPQNRIENIPDDLAAASLQGQIDTLYLEKGLEIPGTITDEGRYDREDEKNDFVQKLVNRVIQTGASAYIFERDDMPEDLEIIARLRF